MTPTTSELSAISRLFSSAVFREMAEKGRSATFARLYAMTGIKEPRADYSTVADSFDSAFAILKRVGLRDEYVYRAAVTHKVLMGKHSLKTACMLTEFRAGSSKADLVILNGTASVYEIKSDRDSLVRLASQISNYKRVFATVNVIASETHLEAVLNTVPEDVGVMCLTSRDSIRTVRDAINRPEGVCPIAVFESLRSAEAKAVLKSLDVKIPEVPNTQMHSALRAIFSNLDPATAHMAMVSTLKRTRNLAPLSHLVDRLPESLHAAAVSVQIHRRHHDRLVQAVSTPLLEAMRWA